MRKSALLADERGRQADVNARAGLGRLEDGTPYFGQLGELAYDPDEDRVQCHLCGDWFRFLGSSHLRRTHGWTLADYREAFHLPVKVASCSRGFSRHQSAYARSQIKRGSGFGEGVGVPVAERHVRVARWRSLAAHPQLVSELAPGANPTLADPGKVAAGSGRKLWWRCGQCGNEWEATVGSRTAGAGCPDCYHRGTRGPRAVAVERSLQALHPGVVAEWHPSRNRGLDPASMTPGSKQAVWWCCAACGHEWRTSVQNRTSQGSGCPVCALERRAKTQSLVTPARSLAVRHPGLAAELDLQRNPGVDPTRLGARSGLKLWWRCQRCGHGWQTAVSNRTQGGTGCPVCGLKRRARAQSRVAPARSLQVNHPELAAELDLERNPGIDPERLGCRSSLKLWWRCRQCRHQWKTAVSTRTDGCGCPACHRAGRRR
jgi:predicted  nucleic acid-binding Zn-ribbon protein